MELNKSFQINRYPKSSNVSLQAWSAADQHLLLKLKEEELTEKSIGILHDTFGFLAVHLQDSKLFHLSITKSQQDAIDTNLKNNGYSENLVHFIDPLKGFPEKLDFALIHVPKALDLFSFFIHQVHLASSPHTKVFCGFMTRHFTKQMLDIAGTYFEDIGQSLAWKKSRVLVLSKPKQKVPIFTGLNTIRYENHRGEVDVFKQYFGVFSAKKIDIATQFLLANLDLKDKIETALDLASGNGVIAKEIRYQQPDCELHLIDDSGLAIASSKLNLDAHLTHFHFDHSTANLPSDYFDLVVCNPPFHFEHENNIEIAISLFTDVARILKPTGSFILVANLHLNYKTHLDKIFPSLTIKALNSKFIIYSCSI